MNKASSLHLWLNTIQLAIVIYALAIIYNWLYRDSLGLATWSEALAATGGLLIGASFALSGLTYFFDFLDSKLKYRKSLGLVGYYLAVAYSVTLLWRFPNRYLSDFPQGFLSLEAVTGLTAMGILTLMAIISGHWATKLLGTHWRPLLRLGYLAYLLLIIRALVLEGDSWMAWLVQPHTLPSPRLLLTVFALSVIALRIGLELALRTKPKTPPESTSTPAV